jgi:Flp pilus assembly protein TadD
MSADDEVEAEEEYKTQANLLKDQGNELFQTGKIQEAILSYTQAIDLDPDNHVFYSNRSAAYMKGVLNGYRISILCIAFQTCLVYD